MGGVLLVCAVCIGVLAAAGGFTYLGYRLDRADAVAALRAYLEEVKAENYAAAYDRLCDRAKEGVSRAEFGEQFPPPRMASFRIGDVSMADRDGESGYHVEVELRLDDGTTVTDTYFVFSRTDDLDRYYICPPDS